MARKPTSPEKRLRIWRIRARRKTLGWVAEPDAESAIRAAIEGFQVDKAHQNRLIAQPVGIGGPTNGSNMASTTPAQGDRTNCQYGDCRLSADSKSL
jgi:hypothetical protein